MILVNNQASEQAFPQLRHAEWHGWTFTDLVFPFFLWIVGVAITLSFSRRVQRGDDKGKLVLHVFYRSAAIFFLGLLLNFLSGFDLATLRIPGVLQRIAVCYLIASVLFLYFNSTARWVWAAGLLIAYWLLMKAAPIPGCAAGTMEIGCNFERYIDGIFLSGHMYDETKTWDPEGIVSTLPAIVNTLFGIFAGELLRTTKTMAEKASNLLVGGNVLVFVALLLSTWMPINKQLWTTPYALFTSGLAFVVFGCCYWLIDGLGWRRGTYPLVVYGSNALAIYVLSGLLSRLAGALRVWPSYYEQLPDPAIASALYGLSHVVVLWFVAYLFYRRGWFLRV